MKLLILLTLTLTIAVACFRPLHAGEFSTEIGNRSMDAGDDSFTVGEWNYLQINYKPEGSNFYYGISTEEAEVSPISYFAWTYSMIGLIVGTESKINDNTSFFSQLGYYDISNDLQSSPVNEGTKYYFNTKFTGAHNYNSYDKATLDNSNAVGGTVGIRIVQPLSENVKLGFSVSHRLLKIDEVLRVYFTDKDKHWAVSTKRDYSSTNFGVNLKYEF